MLGRWTRVFSDVSDLSLQAYIDQTHLADPAGPLMLAAMPFSPAGTFYDDLTTYDIDFQTSISGGLEQPGGLGPRLSVHA